MFVLCCIWFIVAFLWITITSALDKEWMIDGRGINNVCDVLMYLEEDDTRDVGVIMTLPLFFPFLWFALCDIQYNLENQLIALVSKRR